MDDLGYAHELFEKSTKTTASAIFYKKEKFNCLQSEQVLFEEGATQFFMYCVFSLASDDSFKFVFGETHLKAKAANVQQRVQQTTMITEFFEKNHRDVPVFMAGDFNEEP